MLHVFINLKIARFLCLLKNVNIILINKMQIFFKKCFYILDCVLLVYYLLYSFIVLCFIVAKVTRSKQEYYRSNQLFLI